MRKKTLFVGDSVPKPLGFNAFAPECPCFMGGWCRPAIPAAGSALGSHPCVALSSAQVKPSINRVGAKKEEKTLAESVNGRVKLWLS